MKKIIICDIDHTICKTPRFATFEDFHKANLLVLSADVERIENLKKLINIDPLIELYFFTARCESLRTDTWEWLCMHGLVDDLQEKVTKLFMRPRGNTDSSAVLKTTTLLQLANTRPAEILVAIDDNVDTVNAFSELRSDVLAVTDIALDTFHASALYKSVRPRFLSYKVHTPFEPPAPAKNDAPLSTTFKKNDKDKPDLSLFEPLTMELYSEASAVGEKKYSRGNWRNITLQDAHRPLAALARHLYGYRDEKGEHGFLRGEERDATDGQRHLASIVWAATTLAYLVEQNGYEAVFKHITGRK